MQPDFDEPICKLKPVQELWRELAIVTERGNLAVVPVKRTEVKLLSELDKVNPFCQSIPIRW